MERYYLPALKGRIGDWWYYSCLMSMPEVVKRIKRSDELYKNKQLSDMVQREISRKRPKEIENYLFTERERFFSAMIVAVFGGAPDWHSFEITAEMQTEVLPDVMLSAGNNAHPGTIRVCVDAPKDQLILRGTKMRQGAQ